MTVYKRPGSPYYPYDLYFEVRPVLSVSGNQGDCSNRVECIEKCDL
jgi:hypothetical protein